MCAAQVAELSLGKGALLHQGFHSHICTTEAREHHPFHLVLHFEFSFSTVTWAKR